MCLASVPDTWRISRDVAPSKPADSIKILSGFEGSAPVEVTRVAEDHYVIRPPEGTELKYLLLKVEGAKGKTLRIDFLGLQFTSWGGANPLYSYCTDLSDPATFASKPASATEFQRGDNGPSLPDTSDQQWHYVEHVWREGMRMCFTVW